MPSPWRKKLDKKVKKYLEGFSGCHDYYHHLRTKNYALKIAKKVGGNEDVIYAASFVHDVGYKESKDPNHHWPGSVKLAKKWLSEISFPKEKIEEVLEAVRLHDNFSWDEGYEPAKSLETKIVQDADRIDSLGAIGVSRLAYFFGEYAFPIYEPKPVKKVKKHWLHHSLIDQMRREGENKWQNLNFPISRKISKKKNDTFKNFYKIFKKELIENF